MRSIDHEASHNQSGFTLIEIIVTIIISSVLAIILAQVMANQTTRSYRPIQMVSDELALRAVMADIASDWKTISADTSNVDPLGTLKENINNGDYWSDKDFSGNPKPEFEVRRNDCIQFDTGGNEQDGTGEGCAILKVSIKIAGSGHHLTTLFAW